VQLVVEQAHAHLQCEANVTLSQPAVSINSSAVWNQHTMKLCDSILKLQLPLQLSTPAHADLARRLVECAKLSANKLAKDVSFATLLLTFCKKYKDLAAVHKAELVAIAETLSSFLKRSVLQASQKL
jgi:hypothetical protein